MQQEAKLETEVLDEEVLQAEGLEDLDTCMVGPVCVCGCVCMCARMLVSSIPQVLLVLLLSR